MNFFFEQSHKKRFDCYWRKRNISTKKKQNFNTSVKKMQMNKQKQSYYIFLL